MILHVILTILKIMGILLLIVLGLLLVMLLLLLFVPLRYRLHVRKEPAGTGERAKERTGDVIETDGSVSWLLRLLKAEITVRDMRGTAVLKICGVRLKTVHFLKKDEKTSREKTEDGEIRKEEAGEEKAPNEEAGEEKSSGQKQEEIPEEHSPENSLQEDSVRADRTGPGKKPSAKPGRGLGDRLTKLAERGITLVLELLSMVPGLPAEVYDRIDIAQEKIHAKSKSIRQKTDPFLSIEAEHMITKGIRYGKYLIRGYKPRKITGYLHFGTGSPDLTGWLTGLVFVLLPEAGTAYDVDPDFYESVLETDTHVKGRIRAYRVVWIGIRLILDREFRTLLARIRGKEKQGHRGRRRHEKNKDRRKHDGRSFSGERRYPL